MKKIITAIGNPKLNEELKLENDIKIICNDIQYQDGIFEILDNNEKIDIIIISETLEGNLDLIQLIEKIKIKDKNIEIIIILKEKKEELENILFSKGILKIIYNNQITIKEIINIIKNQNNNKSDNEELKKEINELKEIIFEKNNGNKFNLYEKNKKEIKNIFKEIKDKIIKKEIDKKVKNKIISISGPSGIGKSIITVNLAKSLMYFKSKILIIDFDILNSSLHTILGVKKYPQKININNKIELNEINIDIFINKINKRIDLISATEILFEINKKIDYIKIERIINELKKRYNYIIIDTSSECFFDLTKIIFKISNKNIFITGTNILEIKKSIKLLNIYINEWKINKEKFNILFNKYDKNCIKANLLKNIFNEFNIIGFLKYDSKYNILINKNIKNNFLSRKIRKEYLEINKKIN